MKLYPRTCFCCYYWILEITIFPSRHTTSFQGFPKIAKAFYAEPGKLIWFLLVSVLKKMRTRPLIKQTETMPSDCNWTRTQNHLVHKRTLNNLAKLTNCSLWPTGQFGEMVQCSFTSEVVLDSSPVAVT